MVLELLLCVPDTFPLSTFGDAATQFKRIEHVAFYLLIRKIYSQVIIGQLLVEEFFKGSSMVLFGPHHYYPRRIRLAHGTLFRSIQRAHPQRTYTTDAVTALGNGPNGWVVGSANGTDGTFHLVNRAGAIHDSRLLHNENPIILNAVW
jgi:hypothetical protein